MPNDGTRRNVPTTGLATRLLAKREAVRRMLKDPYSIVGRELYNDGAGIIQDAGMLNVPDVHVPAEDRLLGEGHFRDRQDPAFHLAPVSIPFTEQEVYRDDIGSRMVNQHAGRRIFPFVGSQYLWPLATTAGVSTELILPVLANHIMIQNNTAANLYFNLDEHATLGSYLLQVNALLTLDAPCRAIFLYTVAAQNINGNAIGGIMVGCWE